MNVTLCKMHRVESIKTCIIMIQSIKNPSKCKCVMFGPSSLCKVNSELIFYGYGPGGVACKASKNNW